MSRSLILAQSEPVPNRKAYRAQVLAAEESSSLCLQEIKELCVLVCLCIDYFHRSLAVVCSSILKGVIDTSRENVRKKNPFFNVFSVVSPILYFFFFLAKVTGMGTALSYFTSSTCAVYLLQSGGSGC